MEWIDSATDLLTGLHRNRIGDCWLRTGLDSLKWPGFRLGLVRICRSYPGHPLPASSASAFVSVRIRWSETDIGQTAPIAACGRKL